MTAQGVYINVSGRNEHLPPWMRSIQNCSIYTMHLVAEILRTYPKLIACKHRIFDQESRSFGRLFSHALWGEKTAYQDDERFAREKNMHNFRNWNRDLMGKPFMKAIKTIKTDTGLFSSSGLLLLNHLNGWFLILLMVS